ncbi:hypothetical protein MMC25_000978 [Agyrium rufum]|nr:hypothetical protein [Agyrium rufum]
MSDFSLHLTAPISTEIDTCFGVINGTATSSFGGSQDINIVPVDIKTRGDLIILYFQDSQKYAGLLNVPVLDKVLKTFTIDLNATLTSVRASKKLSSGMTKPTDARECSVRIVMYGMRIDGPAVGIMLSDANVFLQHPAAFECATTVVYSNPHYLLRPGSQMPDLEALTITSEAKSSSQQAELNEVNKARLLRIFDCADLDLTNIPKTVKPSLRLQSTLMGHQLMGLAMMIEKECGIIQHPCFPALWIPVDDSTSTSKYLNTVTKAVQSRPVIARGGILADEMGLGKTLTVLALICSSLDQMESQGPNGLDTQTQGTLIVAPMSTITAWQDQIGRHILPGRIHYAVYHGSDRHELVVEMQKYNIVVTTYETLRSEWEAGGPLFRTPIHNSLDDYRALLAFLGIEPFREKSLFDFWIAKPVKEKKPGSLERLKDLVKATCLRRTKRSSSVRLNPLPLVERVEDVQLHEDDQALYDFFKERAANLAAGLRPKKTKEREKPNGMSMSMSNKRGGKEENILALMIILRLICNHGKELLPASALAIWNARSSSQPDWSLMKNLQLACYVCGGHLEEIEETSITKSEDKSRSMKPCQPTCGTCTLSEEACMVMEHPLHLNDEARVSQFDNHGESLAPRRVRSAKVLRLLRNLRAEETSSNTANPVKSVVFSHSTKMLDLVGLVLRDLSYVLCRIDGQSSLPARREALEHFDHFHQRAIMIATIGSCGEGYV